MTTQTLSRVTLQTLENYRTAATQGVEAYRLGGRRLIGAVNGALESRVYPRTAKIAPRATKRMDEVRGSVSEFVVKGIEQSAHGTEKAIERGSSTAAAQVKKLARFASGIDNEIVASGLHTVAQMTMPGAKVALLLSSKVAEGANALADAAGKRHVRKAVRATVAGAKRQAAAATRKTKAPVKAATRRVAKATKAVTRRVEKVTKAPVAKARPAARRPKVAVAETAAA